MKIFPDKQNKAFIFLKKKIIDRNQKQIDIYYDENKDWRVYNTILALNTRKLNQINLMDQLKKLKVRYDGIDTNKGMIKKISYVNNSRMINVY